MTNNIVISDPLITNTANIPIKRGRGRPKGSKNKIKNNDIDTNTKPAFDKEKRCSLIKERWTKINEDIVPF